MNQKQTANPQPLTLEINRQLVDDFKNSVLIVSVFINLTVFVAWLVLLYS